MLPLFFSCIYVRGKEQRQRERENILTFRFIQPIQQSQAGLRTKPGTGNPTQASPVGRKDSLHEPSPVSP